MLGKRKARSIFFLFTFFTRFYLFFYSAFFFVFFLTECIGGEVKCRIYIESEKKRTMGFVFRIYTMHPWFSFVLLDTGGSSFLSYLLDCETRRW